MSSDAVLETLGLLEYLLQHKMLIPAFLYLSQLEVDSLYLWGETMVEYGYYIKVPVPSYHGDVPIFKVHNLVGILNDWSRVAAKEELVSSDTHDKRALFPRRYNLVRIALVKYRYGIGSNHLVQGYLDSSKEVAALFGHYILYELYKDF